MDTKEIIEYANSISVQRLIVRYFASRPCYFACEIGGATFVVEPSRHRTGLPIEAVASRYVVTHVAEGWSFVLRTVWLEEELLQPAATHTSIDHYLDDDGRHGDDAAVVAQAVNCWLRKLDL